jgi:hypothetical protein
MSDLFRKRIKLTHDHGEDLYINPAHIVMVWAPPVTQIGARSTPPQTHVVLVTNVSLPVKETVD